ncbi:hypothetical protein ACFPRL_07310 [Pseudoclavibacter helvolus]
MAARTIPTSNSVVPVCCATQMLVGAVGVQIARERLCDARARNPTRAMPARPVGLTSLAGSPAATTEASSASPSRRRPLSNRVMRRTPVATAAPSAVRSATSSLRRALASSSAQTGRSSSQVTAPTSSTHAVSQSNASTLVSRPVKIPLRLTSPVRLAATCASAASTATPPADELNETSSGRAWTGTRTRVAVTATASARAVPTMKYSSVLAGVSAEVMAGTTSETARPAASTEADARAGSPALRALPNHQSSSPATTSGAPAGRWKASEVRIPGVAIANTYQARVSRPTPIHARNALPRAWNRPEGESASRIGTSAETAIVAVKYWAPAGWPNALVKIGVLASETTATAAAASSAGRARAAGAPRSRAASIPPAVRAPAATPSDAATAGRYWVVTNEVTTAASVAQSDGASTARSGATAGTSGSRGRRRATTTIATQSRAPKAALANQSAPSGHTASVRRASASLRLAVDRTSARRANDATSAGIAAE